MYRSHCYPEKCCPSEVNLVAKKILKFIYLFVKSRQILSILELSLLVEVSLKLFRTKLEQNKFNLGSLKYTVDSDR